MDSLHDWIFWELHNSWWCLISLSVCTWVVFLPDFATVYQLPRLSLDHKHFFTEAFCDWLTHLPWMPAGRRSLPATLLSVSCCTAAASVQAHGAQECRENPSHLGWHGGQYNSSHTSLAAVSVKEATACNFPCVLQLLYSSWVHAGMWSSQENARKGKEYRKQRTWS